MTEPLTVFFDGGCPLCRREIAHYRRLQALGPIQWVDVTRERALLRSYGLDPITALASFHVAERGSGRLHTGAAAFLCLWEMLPGYRWLARTVTVLRLSPLLERVYRIFARRHFRKRCRDGACGG